MSDATIRLLQAVERSATTPIDGNLCREVIAENILLREGRALAPPEPTEDQVLDLMRSCWGAQKMRDAMTVTLWKDGIDIQRPSHSLMQFVAGIRAMPLQDHGKPHPPKMRAETTPEMLELARRLVLERPSTSYIQRKLEISYNHACEIMEHFEAQGLVSARRADGTRVILAEDAISEGKK